MTCFDCSELASLDEAFALPHAGCSPAHQAAGGTDLPVQVKEPLRPPANVVNMKKSPGVDHIVYGAKDGLPPGALVITRQVGSSPITLRHDASWAKTATDFAPNQVRHRATVAGDVCRTLHPADTLPPLRVDGAVLRLHGPARPRRCEVQDFCTGPGRTMLAMEAKGAESTGVEGLQAFGQKLANA